VDVVTALDAADPNWKDTFRAEAADAWTKVVRGFAKRAMREAAKKFRLRIPSSSWPRPDALPTFWHQESFYVAKVCYVLVDSQKQLTSKKSLDAMPDMLDRTHYGDAAYADILVTQDENFLKVATIARTALKVLTFDDFAKRVLARALALGIT
jgi:hypothetical protein